MCGATGTAQQEPQNQNNIGDGDNAVTRVDVEHEELQSEEDGHQRRHRVRQRHGVSADIPSTGPLDLPTWAASPFGQWQPRDLVNRTPQHLTTLKAPPPVSLPSNAWSAPPLFLNEEYLVMGTTDGCVCIWPAEVLAGVAARRGTGTGTSSLLSDPDGSAEATVNHDAVLPGAVVDTATGPRANRRSSIVQLAAAPLGIKLVPEVDASLSEDSGEATTLNDGTTAHVRTVDETPLAMPATHQVVAVTVLGDVHVISISATGTASLAFSWNTARCGITCATVYDNGNIILGYQSGYLEAWSLAGDDNDTRKSQNRRVVAKLVFRGSFGNHSPIRSVAPMTSSMDQPNKESGKSESQEYLVVTLQPETRRSSASLLEVINIVSVEKAWQVREDKWQVREDNTSVVEVSLEEHWVLPEAGMEIIDASSLPLADTVAGAAGGFTRRTAAQWLPSSGTDCLCLLPKNADGSASVAVGLSDGTMGILSAPTVSKDESLSWGVAKAADQVLFQYPAVGLGHVNTVHSSSRQSGDKKTHPHVACCLRGATTYLIPLNSDDDAPENPPVTVISYPNDIDADMGIQHLQGFTAGNLRLSDQSSSTAAPLESHTIPVLFYAWPGGVVDVYCCELLKPPTETEHYRPILIELIQNGSVQLLQSFLSTCQEDVWRDRPEWSAARNEIVGTGEEGMDPSRTMTISKLCSSEFRSFRGLLLQVADTEGTMAALG
jgi:hypothetical protein